MTFKATLDRKALKAALDLGKVPGAAIVSSRMQHPILSTVLLQGTRDKVTLRITDLDTGVLIELPAAYDGAAADIAVDLDTLRKAVGKSKAEHITLSDIGPAVLFEGGATLRLHKGKVEDWPSAGPLWARIEDGAAFTFDAAALASDLADANVCVSHDPTRYYLHGVLFHTVEREGRALLRMAATDGHRMARVSRDADAGELAKLPDAIVPQLACSMLARMLAKHDGECRTVIGKTRATFAFGRVKVFTKLIDGTFPDYSRVMFFKDRATRRLQLHPGAASAAIEAVTAHCGQRAIVTVSCHPGEPTAVQATDVDTGTARAELGGSYNFDASCGGSFYIGMNAGYLRQLLARCAGEVTFYIQDASAPVRIESADKPHLVNILMPVRVEMPRNVAATPLDDFNDAGPGLAAMVAPHVRLRKELGRLATAAIDFIAPEQRGGRVQARAVIKARLAAWRDDPDEAERLGALAYELGGDNAPDFATYVARERAVIEVLEAAAMPEPMPEPEPEPVAPDPVDDGQPIDGEAYGPSSEGLAELEALRRDFPAFAFSFDYGKLFAKIGSGIHASQAMRATVADTVVSMRDILGDPPASGATDYMREGQPLYSNLQAFKAAAGQGSRWLIENYAPGLGWQGGRERTVVTVRARQLGFVDFDPDPETMARLGAATGNRERSWIEFPRQGEWRSDGAGLVTFYPDGTPRTRLTPLAPVAAAAPAEAAGTGESALVAAVAALTARLGDAGQVETVDALERRVGKLQRRNARLQDINASRRERVRDLEADLSVARAEAARLQRMLRERDELPAAIARAVND